MTRARKMAEAKAQTKEFKYPQILHSAVAEEGSIDGKVEQQDRFWAFLEKMLERARTQGVDMKLGDSGDCLSYRELKILGLEGYDQAPRGKADYESHFAGCNVCGPLLKVYQEYLQEMRSPAPVVLELDRDQAHAVLLQQIRDYMQSQRQAPSR